MATAFNQVILMGNLTRTPELKKTTTGKSVAKIGVAVNRSFKNAKNETVTITDFFDVVVWTAEAERCCKYLTKGRGVHILGKITTKTYMKNGEKKKELEIVADNVQFLGRPANATVNNESPFSPEEDSDYSEGCPPDMEG